jgi:hypothetical protein
MRACILKKMIATNNDILKCPKCGLTIISEEIKTHQCRKKVLDYKIENNLIWLYDGEIWYPRKLISPKNKHPDITPEDSTAPKFPVVRVSIIKRDCKWIGYLFS